ncbi:hypothetical protein CABS01_08694, partial [Colletotrichum abscissum]|uniref:uncharacterized protein n=1 Tax=Colletotrichum abscissum TaxID=1671311 RepID=UPI0027D5CF7F
SAVPDQRQGDQHPEPVPSSPKPSLTPKQTTADDEQRTRGSIIPPRRYTDDTFLLLQEHRLLENTPDDTRPDPRPPDPSTTIRRLGAIFS